VERFRKLSTLTILLSDKYNLGIALFYGTLDRCLWRDCPHDFRSLLLRQLLSIYRFSELTRPQISEVPSNLILKKVGAKVRRLRWHIRLQASRQIWLPILGIAFGVCTICTALIHNASEFLAMRVLLGITESGGLLLLQAEPDLSA
jgi:hypothetical protein